MKKVVFFALTFMLCMLMGACSSEDGSILKKQEPEEIVTVETVTVGKLYEFTSNKAKYQQNVGKQVTVVGQVYKIEQFYCIIDLLEPIGSYVHVYMPVDELANLFSGQFIAVTGTIESVSIGNYPGYEPRYDISATKAEDYEVGAKLADDIVANIIESANAGAYPDASSLYKHILILEDYMLYNSDRYTMQDDAELAKYLCGEWDCGYYKLYIHHDQNNSKFTTLRVEYNADGTFSAEGENWPKAWSVSNGKLNSFVHGSPTVYILTDDIFFYGQHVFVRQK